MSEFISFSLSDAGHIPGSASVLFTVKDGDRVKKIVFSGDLGSKYSKLVTLRQNCKQTDAVFVESTYGGNPRKILFSDYGKFYMDLKRELESGKIVWIPALSLQRTQKVLYEIKKIKDNGAIDAEIPVYSLSPSSNGLTELYENEIKNPSFEKWFMPFIYEGGGIIPDNYKTKKAKKYPKPCIILSASGMMDKGVSLSLLGKLLPREDVSVFLVSYASPQTPAGQLKKGGKTVRTKYGKIKVKASVETFDVFSDHADITEISLWLDKKTNKNASVFLVHGEKKSLDSSKKFLTDYGFTNVSEVYPCKKIIVK